MNNIDTILTKLKFKASSSKTSVFSDKEYQFWSSLTKKQIEEISDAVLQKPGTSLTYLDKYSIDELDYIFNMFPLEIINKKIKNVMNKLDKFYIYSIMDYRVYNTNLELIKNIKNYKKQRIKQDKNKK